MSDTNDALSWWPMMPEVSGQGASTPHLDSPTSDAEKGVERTTSESQSSSLVGTFRSDCLDLGAIRARCEAATPGPWVLVEDSGEENTIRARGKVVAGVVATVRVKWVHESQRTEQAANARFIAHARSDIPALLSRLEKAEKKAASWEKSSEEWRAKEIETARDNARMVEFLNNVWRIARESQTTEEDSRALTEIYGMAAAEVSKRAFAARTEVAGTTPRCSDAPKEHPEDTCERCGRLNVKSWHAPSPLWNAVMRDPNTGDDRYGIVCPICFAALAEECGISGVWCFKPHDLDVESLWKDRDGRVWNGNQCLWIDAAGNTSVYSNLPNPEAVRAKYKAAIDLVPVDLEKFSTRELYKFLYAIDTIPSLLAKIEEAESDVRRFAGEVDAYEQLEEKLCPDNLTFREYIEALDSIIVKTCEEITDLESRLSLAESNNAGLAKNYADLQALNGFLEKKIEGMLEAISRAEYWTRCDKSVLPCDEAKRNLWRAWEILYAARTGFNANGAEE